MQPDQAFIMSSTQMLPDQPASAKVHVNDAYDRHIESEMKAFKVGIHIILKQCYFVFEGPISHVMS